MPGLGSEVGALSPGSAASGLRDCGKSLEQIL